MTTTFLAPDGAPITAQQFRQAHASLYGGGSGRQLGGRSGFRVGTPADTLTATSTTWTLKPCSAEIDPGASTHQGMYGWASDANITGAVDPSDATYARKDIVFIQINDSSAGDGSGAVTTTVRYVAGTASATPTAPALGVLDRTRSFLVGTIDVPKTGAGSPTVTLNPARFVAAGAPLPATLAERDALVKYDGLTVQRTDVAGRPLESWDGTEWKRFSSVYAHGANDVFFGFVGAGSSLGPYAQTFPAGKYSVPPVVVPGSDQTRLSLAASDVTKDGFNLYISNWTDASVPQARIRWTVTQMTATSAAG